MHHASHVMSIPGGGSTPKAVAVNKALSANDLSEAQVCEIFAGKIKFWNDVGRGDAKIMVLTRKKEDASVETIRENRVSFKSLQITAEAIALVRGSEVLDSLDKRPNTVGIVNVGTSLRERQNVNHQH